MKWRLPEKAVEFIRREGKLALPAASRAAQHAVRAFIRKFPEEYERERRKKR